MTTRGLICMTIGIISPIKTATLNHTHERMNRIICDPREYSKFLCTEDIDHVHMMENITV